MKTILDISTLLGGVAALWFFWDQISAFRSRKKNANDLKFRKRTSLEQKAESIFKVDQIATAVFCAIGGILLGTILGEYGYTGLGVSIFVIGLLWLIGGKLDDMGYETIGSVLIFCMGFMFFWSDTVMLLCVLAEAITGVYIQGLTIGVLASIGGAIAGATFGAYITK